MDRYQLETRLYECDDSDLNSKGVRERWKRKIADRRPQTGLEASNRCSGTKGVPFWPQELAGGRYRRSKSLWAEPVICTTVHVEHPTV
mgnify:CR=1 FL=1